VIGRLKEQGYLGNLAFAPNGETVVAADGDPGALVMPLDGGKPYWLAPPLRGGSIGEVAVRRNGNVIGTSVTPAVPTSSESWNLTRHRRLPLIPDTSEDAKAIGRRAGVSDPLLAIVAKDGHTFAIGDGDGRVWLWDSRQSDPATLLGGNAEATSEYYGSPALAFSPDGKTLAVGEPFRLWDVSSRKPLGSPLSGGSEGLEFSPNGRALAAVVSGNVRLWEPIAWSNLDDLREQICSLVAGDLTRHEWESIATGIAYRRSCSR
jgi:WD40 repeat protein